MQGSLPGRRYIGAGEAEQPQRKSGCSERHPTLGSCGAWTARASARAVARTGVPRDACAGAHWCGRGGLDCRGAARLRRVLTPVTAPDASSRPRRPTTLDNPCRRSVALPPLGPLGALASASFLRSSSPQPPLAPLPGISGSACPRRGSFPSKRLFHLIECRSTSPVLHHSFPVVVPPSDLQIDACLLHASAILRAWRNCKAATPGLGGTSGLGVNPEPLICSPYVFSLIFCTSVVAQSPV